MRKIIMVLMKKVIDTPGAFHVTVLLREQEEFYICTDGTSVK